ncbi:tetratricopeptide repeat protein [Streptacidiphilus sp. PAMC 29251]
MARPSSQIHSHPLALLRAERGWTHQDVVDLLAARLGLAANRAKSIRWEAEVSVPDEDTQRALAAEIGVPVERLKEVPWPDWLPKGDSLHTEASWTLRGCVDALNKAVGGTLDRRGFLTLPSGAGTAFASAWAAAPAPDLSATHPRDSNVGIVDTVEERLDRLRALEATHGGPTTRVYLERELDAACELLRARLCGPAETPRLLAAIAEIARLTGWAHVDAGRLAAAERYLVGALRAAHAADDPLLGANVLKSLALVLLDSGRPAEALEVAEIACRRIAHAPAAMQAMLTVRQARAAAIAGDITHCDRLLVRAETLMARVDPADPVPAWAWFDVAEFRVQVATCHRAAGRNADAAHWFEWALADQPGTRPPDRVTLTLLEAEAAAGLGEVERSCALLDQVLPNLARGTSQRNLDRYRRVRQLLPPAD